MLEEQCLNFCFVNHGEFHKVFFSVTVQRLDLYDVMIIARFESYDRRFYVCCVIACTVLYFLAFAAHKTRRFMLRMLKRNRKSGTVFSSSDIKILARWRHLEDEFSGSFRVSKLVESQFFFRF